MKFSIKDFFSKCDQICRYLRIWSHLLKESLMVNLFLCAATHCVKKFYLRCLIGNQHCTNVKFSINPFSTNVPLMDKPGSWLLLTKCLKNTCGRVKFYLKCFSNILLVKANYRVSV